MSDEQMREESPKIKCHFGDSCESAVVLAYLPEGCVCHPEKWQWLCAQHWTSCEDIKGAYAAPQEVFKPILELRAATAKSAARIAELEKARDGYYHEAATAYEKLHKAEAALVGPDGFATWQDAALAERIKRVEAEAERGRLLAAIGRALDLNGRDQEEANAVLRAAIENAPHSVMCSSLMVNSDVGGCDCWKRDALEGE